MQRTKGTGLVKWGVIGVVASIVFAIVPLAIMLLAGAVANALGCNLDEAASYSCLLGPVDIGGALSFLGMMGWLSFFTFPLGALAALLSLGAVIAGLTVRGAALARTETTAKGKLMRFALPAAAAATLVAVALLLLSAI